MSFRQFLKIDFFKAPTVREGINTAICCLFNVFVDVHFITKILLVILPVICSSMGFATASSVSLNLDYATSANARAEADVSHVYFNDTLVSDSDNAANSAALAIAHSLTGTYYPEELWPDQVPFTTGMDVTAQMAPNQNTHEVDIISHLVFSGGDDFVRSDGLAETAFSGTLNVAASPSLPPAAPLQLVVDIEIIEYMHRYVGSHSWQFSIWGDNPTTPIFNLLRSDLPADTTGMHETFTHARSYHVDILAGQSLAIEFTHAADLSTHVPATGDFDFLATLTVIPEPATLTLLALGVLTTRHRRRR